MVEAKVMKSVNSKYKSSLRLRPFAPGILYFVARKRVQHETAHQGNGLISMIESPQARLLLHRGVETSNGVVQEGNTFLYYTVVHLIPAVPAGPPSGLLAALSLVGLPSGIVICV